VLGSVTDKALLRRLFKTHRFDAVYHAAAYKHVPIVERFPEQAVRVNVLGTRAVAESAIHAGVKDFVLVSTDKAVRPRNAMGASKRVAELVIQALADNGGSTRLSMVRFGNVLGSSGSVVPKFQQQILKGGPITLTHREITRYFMTIPEAAQLVLQAGAVAKSGDVFVLDMGEPVRIEDLAKTMVHLYGKRLHEDTGSDEDIKIEVGGLRAGEKMFEELFLSTTERRPTGVRKVFTASEPFMGWSQLSGKLETLKSYADAGDDDHVRQLLLELAFYDTSVGDERPSKPSRAYVAETRRERTAATEVH
jgi:FlaA1/EpsC-like NDP-sugar epimerase